MAGKFASGLALFSLGLGLAEALMPKTMAKAIGIDENDSGAIRALGLREVGHGLSIMMAEKPTPRSGHVSAAMPSTLRFSGTRRLTTDRTRLALR